MVIAELAKSVSVTIGLVREGYLAGVLPSILLGFRVLDRAVCVTSQFGRSVVQRPVSMSRYM